jgi:hypothetical protein
VGLKVFSSGEISTAPALRIHVRRKLSARSLSPARLFPKELDGVPVDVMSASYSSADACNPDFDVLRQPQPTIYGGLSIGRANSGTFGTLGLVVLDRFNRYAMLTAAHVAGQPQGQVNQPGGSTLPAGVVGEREFSPDMDAAVIAPLRQVALGVFGVSVPTTIVNINSDAQIGMPVRIVGACSGPRHGTLIGRHLNIDVSYQSEPDMSFEEQLQIGSSNPGVPFNNHGDSGSIVLTEDGTAVIGLLFAREDTEGYGVATPITRIFSQLSLSLATLQ